MARYLANNLKLVAQQALYPNVRTLQTTGIRFGDDARDKRTGHVKKIDRVEGERPGFAGPNLAYELIDENLLETVIDNIKFKDIPYVYIKCTRNNTKITLSQGNGKIIIGKSCGTEGFKNCRKGTTVAAQAVANRILTGANDLGIDKIRLVFNGLGPGRDAAFKVFEQSNLRVVSLSDRTEAVEPWIHRPRKAKSI